ncbi:tyrosine-type recombinase/integrase [Candidatus Margulisiibacteriota bacterium]
MNLQTEYLTNSEINALLKVIKDPRDRAIIILVLCTGINKSELIALTTNAIDWENRVLKITGRNEREIPLNDQAFAALAAWSKERPDTPCPYFFITLKGTVKGISYRQAYDILSKYAKTAGLEKTVNMYTLRNTFAVNLFAQGIKPDKAVAISGRSSRTTIRLYARKSKAFRPEPVKRQEPEKLTGLDTRTAFDKWLSKRFPEKPREPRPITPVSEPITLDPETTILGRDNIINELRLSLNKGQSILITGKLGLGKTHLLKHMAWLLKPNAVYISAPSPIKNLLTQICNSHYPGWKRELTGNISNKDIMDYLSANKINTPPILVIDKLENIRTTNIETFLFLLENFTVLGAAETTKPALKQIWWKFKQKEIPPLKNETIRELIHYLTRNLTVKDYHQMENKIMNTACGNLLAVVEMIRQLSFCNIVNDSAIDEIHHEAGQHYRHWSWVIIVAWGGAMMFRFISLGSRDFEGYILAGMCMSVLMVVKSLVFRRR